MEDDAKIIFNLDDDLNLDNNSGQELKNLRMVIDNKILDELTAKAKVSERLRANLDLRNSPDDQ